MARKLTVDDLVGSGMSREAAQKLIDKQNAPAVRERQYFIDKPLNDADAQALQNALQSIPATKGAKLVRRFKNAKKAEAKKPAAAAKK